MHAMLSAEKWSEGHSPSLKPEWLRVPDAIRTSGIGRSSLYSLIKEGKVRSVCIRNRNSIRGIRLINSDSLSKFIESFAPEGTAHDT